MRQLTLDLRPHVVPTMENFVPGDNQALLDALLVHAQTTDGSVLYLWGEQGSGKTHLLRAIANEAEHSGRPAAFLANDPALHTPPLIDGLMAIDDVDQLDATGQANLFRLLISAREARGALVLAGSGAPQSLPLREDVRTRIGQGLLYAIQPLSDTDKATLLRCNASLRGITLDADIVEYLLRHGRRDLSWLMTVLDALDEASLTEGRRITLPLLRDLLRDTCEPELPFSSFKP